MLQEHKTGIAGDFWACRSFYSQWAETMKGTQLVLLHHLLCLCGATPCFPPWNRTD
jgi:hypothetical protein